MLIHCFLLSYVPLLQIFMFSIIFVCPTGSYPLFGFSTLLLHSLKEAHQLLLIKNHVQCTWNPIHLFSDSWGLNEQIGTKIRKWGTKKGKVCRVSGPVFLQKKRSENWYSESGSKLHVFAYWLKQNGLRDTSSLRVL